MDMTPDEIAKLIEENKKEVSDLLKDYFKIMEKEERKKREERAAFKCKRKRHN